MFSPGQQPHYHQLNNQHAFGSSSSISSTTPASNNNISINPFQRASKNKSFSYRLFTPIRRLKYRISVSIERLQPYYVARWVFTALLLFGFMARVILGKGWYVVAYALWIFLLNAFLSFLSPKFDPSGELDNDADLSDRSGPALPITTQNLVLDNDEGGADDEFRPFVRRLPEFIFWHSSTVAVVLSIFASCFAFFDIPVFWPILLFYFVLLFTLTMKRQIKHMIKYKYIPFDFGKKSYVKPTTSIGLSSSSLKSPQFSNLSQYVPPVPYSARDAKK